MNRLTATLTGNGEFQRYCDRWLAPLLPDQQVNRSGALKTAAVRAIAGLVCFALFGYGLWALFEFGEDFAGWLAFCTVCAVILVLGVWIASPLVTQKRVAKDLITPRLVAFFGDFRFQWDGQFRLETLGRWDLLAEYSKSKFQDVITGSFRGVPVRFAELKLLHERRGTEVGRTKQTFPVFDGVYAEYQLSDRHNGPLVLASKNAAFRRHARQKGWRVVESGAKDFVAATLDDGAPPSTPGGFLDLLRDMQQRSGARHVMAAFGEQTLLILLEGARGAFEPPTKAIDVSAEARAVQERLALLCAPIERCHLRPSAEIRDQPLVLDQEKLQQRASRHDEGFDGLGCLPILILSTAFFLGFGWLLNGTEAPGWSLLLAVIGSPLLASACFDASRGIQKDLRFKGWTGPVMKILLTAGVAWFVLRG